MITDLLISTKLSEDIPLERLVEVGGYGMLTMRCSMGDVKWDFQGGSIDVVTAEGHCLKIQ